MRNFNDILHLTMQLDEQRNNNFLFLRRTHRFNTFIPNVFDFQND